MSEKMHVCGGASVHIDVPLLVSMYTTIVKDTQLDLGDGTVIVFSHVLPTPFVETTINH